MSSFSLTPLVVLAVLLAGCDRGAPEAAQETKPAGEASRPVAIDDSEAGTPLPKALLTDPSGRTLDTAALRGRPVLVNLWATWCAPCVKEMPLLDALAADYAGRLKVVTVSEDLEGAAKVVPFFAARDLKNLPQWIDRDNALMFAMGAGNLPLTVLYDAEGREVWRVAGDFDWAGEEARAAIDAAIAS